MLDDFWRLIDIKLERLVHSTTVDAVLDICTVSGTVGDGFWFGSGDEMLDALYDAGWRFRRYKAPYDWTVQEPQGDQCLTYCEGDLYRVVSE